MPAQANFFGNRKCAFLFVFGSVTGVALFAAARQAIALLQNLLSAKITNLKLLKIANATSTAGDGSFAIDRIQRSLEIGKTMLHQLVRIFIRDVERGLENDYSTLKCIPSCIHDTPSGSEQGNFLTFVLGGSNYRVALVSLLGKGRSRCTEMKSELPETVKVETSEILFGFCAEKVEELYAQEKLDKNEPMKMGFTFSFPVQQETIKSGKLLWWTKGFVVDNSVGHCVVEMFQTALDKKGFNITIEALVNDAVAIFLASSYSDDSTQLGVVLGTGNNAAYIEDVSNVPKLSESLREKGGKMIINMEWGGWGSDGSILPTTIFDVKVDRASYNPRMQIYEKMISGMYIGEVARYIILDLISTGELFLGAACPLLMKPHSFTVVNMSRIERDYSPDLSATRSMLEDTYEITDIKLEDLKLIRKICELVSTRAARIASVGIAAALTKIKKVGGTGSTVAINGSVFEHYPHFQNRMKDAFRELFGVAAEEILLTQAIDGPIIGAAIAAAMAANNGNPSKSATSQNYLELV